MQSMMLHKTHSLYCLILTRAGKSHTESEIKTQVSQYRASKKRSQSISTSTWIMNRWLRLYSSLWSTNQRPQKYLLHGLSDITWLFLCQLP